MIGQNSPRPPLQVEPNPVTMITPQPWFDLPDFEQHLTRLELTPQQVSWARQLREEGYFVIEEPVVDAALLDETTRALQGKYVDPATGEKTERIQDAWQLAPAVKQLALAPRILDTLRALYQRRPVPFQTLNFAVGTQQRAHSDTLHFNSLPYGFMCGVWVALEDIDRDNGPLFYYPGSHKLPVYHMQDLGLRPLSEDYVKYEDAVEELLKQHGFARRQGLIKKGQAIVWAANLFHGGSPVIDPTRTRQSQVTHYYFDGAIYYTPHFSDPLKGQFMIRHLRDLGTMQLRPQLTLPQSPELLKDLLIGLMKQVPQRVRRLFH